MASRTMKRGVRFVDRRREAAGMAFAFEATSAQGLDNNVFGEAFRLRAMLYAAANGCLTWFRFATTSAAFGSDRFLHRAIVVVLNLLVVGRLPVNEDANAYEDVVGLILRNDALRNAVGDCLGNGMLGRAEHLQGLFGALDGYLIEQNGRWLAEQIRRHLGGVLLAALAVIYFSLVRRRQPRR